MNWKNGPLSSDDMEGQITLENNGKVLDFFPDMFRRLIGIWALSEADGIDYTDPEEPKLLVATLMYLDALDGKWSVSLLTKCSTSPDVKRRYIFSYKNTKTCFFNEEGI
ncbi:unnamed protein product [Lactuca virosa]|uniref:Uncharacterized protein n=1 Tax=Lactuca virosa TaxID=75947 RepID=A0AAU9NG01_9ASTR|nr:unnamed protein product [Lactuca virosa]